MRILVYGAGVIGSIYAARLHAAGQQVTVLARGRRLEEIQKQGIVVEAHPGGRRSVAMVPVTAELGAAETYDLILVAVRSHQLGSVLPALARNRNTPSVLFLGNNASGPDSLTRALGDDRVLLGFPGARGIRCEGIVRYELVHGRLGTTTIGELHGRTTHRLLNVAATWRQAGLPVAICNNIDAWLKTHAALVSPLANALYMVGGDNYRLAHTRDGVVLMVRAMREGLRVLKALDISITPPVVRTIEWVPEPILVAVLQRLLDTPRAALVVAGYANAARDEMQQLADEFQALVRATSVPTPAIDCLYTYLDTTVTPVAAGRAQIPLQWRSLWIAIGALGAATLVGQHLWRRWRRRT
ncbi:MAG: ketopantoate reductase family protein [Anaerolineae bacterium]